MEILRKYFSDFSEVQNGQFAALRDLYRDWNTKINVISRKDIDQLYLHHVLHSLSVAAAINFEDGCQIIDIGCGGGFPGIPLAIFFPNVRFHLVDSINKKLNVVREISTALSLKNVSTEHIRAEEIKNRTFDYAVSRAVAPLKSLWQWSRPLLNGKAHKSFRSGLICLKGGDLHQEIADSGVKPRIINLTDVFEEEFFKEKYLLFVPK